MKQARRDSADEPIQSPFRITAVLVVLGLVLGACGSSGEGQVAPAKKKTSVSSLTTNESNTRAPNDSLVLLDGEKVGQTAVQLSASALVVAVNGTVTLTASGGVSPYTYSLVSSVHAGESIAGSGANGTYTAPSSVPSPANAQVKVTDANGASRTVSLHIKSSGAVTSITPNDDDFSQLWSLHNDGSGGGSADADIDGKEGWAVGADCSGVIVAVVDSGVDYTHVDLQENIWRNSAEIVDNGVNEGSGDHIDDIYGWDFVNSDNSPMDGNGHGTHVAGIVGAVGSNNLGTTGVCWRAKLMAVRVLDDSGSGYISDVAEGIEYAKVMGAEVINLSLGTYSNSSTLSNAISDGSSGDLEILFAVAAGNDGDNIEISPTYPAAYTHANLIAVAASNSTDGLASFSNYGSTSVDIAAPGSSIYNTYPSDDYATLSGTSMASPHVAGVLASYWAKNLASNAATIRSRILSQDDNKAAFTSTVVSGGRLNLCKVLGGSGC